MKKLISKKNDFKVGLFYHKNQLEAKSFHFLVKINKINKFQRYLNNLHVEKVWYNMNQQTRFNLSLIDINKTIYRIKAKKRTP